MSKRPGIGGITFSVFRISMDLPRAARESNGSLLASTRGRPRSRTSRVLPAVSSMQEPPISFEPRWMVSFMEVSLYARVPGDADFHHSGNHTNRRYPGMHCSDDEQLPMKLMNQLDAMGHDHRPVVAGNQGESPFATGVCRIVMLYHASEIGPKFIQLLRTSSVEGSLSFPLTLRYPLLESGLHPPRSPGRFSPTCPALNFVSLR